MPIEALLPAVAWAIPLILFCAPAELMMLASSVLLHEGGHLLGFAITHEPPPTPAAVAAGLILTPKRPLPYRHELLIALLGPLANLCAAAIFLGLARAPGALATLGAIHLLSALANLIPLPKTDGSRILFDILALLLPLRIAEGICRAVSGITFCALLFLTLFLLLIPGSLAPFLLLGMLVLRAVSLSPPGP